jgi:hypothetical protein
LWRSPNLRVGSSDAHLCSFALNPEYPRLRLPGRRPRCAAVQRRPPRLPVGRCKPAASLRHVPGSPRLGLRRLRPGRAASADAGRCLPRRARRPPGGFHVHCRSVGGSAAQLCPCGPAAAVTQSPPRSPHGAPMSRPGPGSRQIRVPVGPRDRPLSVGFGPAVLAQGGSATGSPALHLSTSLAAPAPSDSPGAPRRCQGRFPPSPAAPGSGCPQLQRTAATVRGGALHPARTNSASWRTLASSHR